MVHRTQTTIDQVARARTAISRTDLSKPIRVALEDGIVTQRTSVLDYGCGRGDDVRHLKAMDIPCAGWDPNFHPTGDLASAHVVNLGYVVNVIENPNERAEVLRSAWNYTKETLIVSARLAREAGDPKHIQCQDGIITGLGTFQKFYEQSELREWIDGILGESPVAAAPGIFYVFRSQEARHQFASSRYRQRLSVPSQQLSDALFEQHRQILDTLMAFYAERGRLPTSDELAEAEVIAREFGSLKRAFAVIRRVTGPEQWLHIEEQRRGDLLIYLALAMFPRMPRLKTYPRTLQLDIRHLFSSYSQACVEAQRLLYSVGKMEVVDAACRRAPVGKLLPKALYVHISALNSLPPELRVFEGCARVLTGKIEGANIVKFSRQEPKISFLLYHRFDQDPHPELAASLKVDLKTLRIRYKEFSDWSNPPILHRKETFVLPHYLHRDKFARLTQQEEKHRLLDEPTQIGARDQWLTLLATRGFCLRGHRLVRAQPHKGD